MFEHTDKEDYFYVIREIEIDPSATQRTLSEKLGISLGKTNYLLHALIKKGFIKARNFSMKPGKLNKINYYLTRRGIQEKIHLTQVFLRKKEAEYLLMKKDWDKLVSDRVKKSAI